MACMTAVPLAVGVLAQAPASAAGAQVSTGRALTDEASPAIDLIQSTFTATLSVPDPTINQGALNNLETTVEGEVASGQIGSDDNSILGAMANAIVNDPLTYWQGDGQTDSESAKVVADGTGFVITPDGYMLTADHVVDSTSANTEVTDAFASFGLSDLSSKAAQGIVQGLQSSGFANVPNNVVTDFTQSVDKFFEQNLTISNENVSVQAEIGTALTGNTKATNPLSVDVVAHGSPYPGKDVAILKAENGSDMPTIGVGQDADVNAGDPLYVVGYPFSSTFQSGQAASSTVTAQLSQGTLAAFKNASGSHAPLLDVDVAGLSGGSSGSPVLDNAGNMVGVFVAEATDSNGNAIQGEDYAIPASMAWELINQSNIHPSQSTTTKLYDQALNDYYQSYYKRALPLFQQVKALYPDHPYVDDFITQSQTAIDQGKDKTPSFPWLVVIIVIVVVLLAGGGGTAGVLMSRRGKKPVLSGAGGPAVPAPGAGSWQPGVQQGAATYATPTGAPVAEGGAAHATAAPTAAPAPGQTVPTAQATASTETVAAPAYEPTVQVATPSVPVEPADAPAAGLLAEPSPVSTSAVVEPPPAVPSPAGAPRSRFCASCGVELPETAAFCPSCGAART
jgi:hypothetical protein